MNKVKKNVTSKVKGKTETKSSFLNTFSGYPSLIIILLAVLCYGKIISFGFLDYDDNLFIVDNHKIIASLSNLPDVFTHGIWSLVRTNAPYDYYRPLLILSLMIDAKAGGTSTVIYHLSNLIYHILACLILFRLLQKLDLKREVALIFAALYTVHPVLTQAVAWIPGRNDVLLSIFLMSSFICFIDYLKSGKRIFLLWHFLLFFLGLMTKETAIGLPVICFLYSGLLLKRKLFSKDYSGYAAAWILLTVVYFFIRTKAIGQTETSLSIGLLAETLLYRLPALVQFAGKAIFPFNLSVKPTQEDTVYFWGIAAIAGVVVALYFSPKKDYRKIVFGAVWFVLFLLPALLVPKNLNDNLFEHRLYLPLIGMLILLSESALFKDAPAARKKRVMMSIGVTALFAILAFNHADAFKGGLVFWQNAAKNSPHDAEAQFFLGKQYFNHGDAANAELYLNKTHALKPDYKRVYAGLAVMYAMKGDMVKARGYYEAEIRLGTKDKEDYKGLGSVLTNLQMPDSAIRSFEKALEIDSTDQTANESVGALYFNRENYVAAKKIWERMIILNPSQQGINKNLAILYSRTGDFNKALSYGMAEENAGGKMPDGFMEDMKRKLAEQK